MSLLEIENLVVRFAGAAQAAVNGVSLALPAGGKLALVGPLGAGKTTLTKGIAAGASLRLRRPSDRDLPSEQEEVVAAERTPTGLQQPSEGGLQDVAGAGAAEIDGFAVRATGGEKANTGAH